MTDFNALLDGYRRFRSGPYNEQRARFDSLSHQGQFPKTLVIACSDSRVDPSRVFDAAPGDMFVVRNIANLVPPYQPDGGLHGVSAALEYAVTQLKVEDIVILGHARCGGVAASLSGVFDNAEDGEGGFVAKWISIMDPARDKIREAAKLSNDINATSALELEAIRVSLANLRTFPFVATAEAEGALKIHGALFDIADGVLRLLDPETDRFAPMALTW